MLHDSRSQTSPGPHPKINDAELLAFRHGLVKDVLARRGSRKATAPGLCCSIRIGTSVMAASKASKQDWPESATVYLALDATVVACGWLKSRSDNARLRFFP